VRQDEMPSIAAERAVAGRDVLPLKGSAAAPLPPHVREAAAAALDEHAVTPPSRGHLELREAIARSLADLLSGAGIAFSLDLSEAEEADLRSAPIVAAASWFSRSSKNCRFRRNDRPPIVTGTSSLACVWAPGFRIRCFTCAGSNGAPMVAIARASEIFAAAASTAAPPRLWPARVCGGAWFTPYQCAAATRSSMLAENSRLEKSKRSVAMPRWANARLT